MENEPLRLSYSKINCFQRCRKQYHWIYNENLIPIKKSFPMQVGLVIHDLLDKYYGNTLQVKDIEQLRETIQRLYPENEQELSDEVAWEAARLFQGYLQYAQDDPLDILMPETVMEVDIGNDIVLYTRLDAVGRSDNRLWRVEHKTTARMDSRYLQGLRKGLQTGIAHWVMEKVLDEPVMGTQFNIIVKTKVPQYSRMPVPKQPWAQNYTQECVYGVARSIRRNDFYPSMKCDDFNNCDYQILCTSDTEANRKAFFKRREEVVDVKIPTEILDE